MEIGEHTLCLGGDAGLCCENRCLAEDREFLHHEPDVVIPGNQLLKRLEDALAIAAIVICEFIDGEPALGVAEDRVAAVLAERHHRLFDALALLAVG